MESYNLYKDIAERTQGEVYIGVVGPVRTGKSTFIRRMMERLVLPGIENLHQKTRIQDELPQSGSGRTVMTTKPEFIPHEAVEVILPEENTVRLRLIDSVGYMIEGALGTQDESGRRMVKTPWLNEAIPFEQAAEIGTQKIIGEHATIGLVITTDGSVTELGREAYIPAERRAIIELKSLNKPFAVIMNTNRPESKEIKKLCEEITKEHHVPVVALDVSQIEEDDIRRILKSVLGQFPAVDLFIHAPEWFGSLEEDHWLIRSFVETINHAVPDQLMLSDAEAFISSLAENEYIQSAETKSIDHGQGRVYANIYTAEGLFNQILAEQCGTEIKGDAHLLSLLRELVTAKREYDYIENALASVRETGYGLVPPKIEEMTLQDPEIMRQGGRFGVKLRASAPSLHLIRVDIQTEVSPVVGTEQQSEEMIRYLLEGFEQDPQKIWQSNLFGKPLSDLMREGLSNKLMHMPADTQIKVQQTLEKIINEGNGGMVCILL